MSLAGGIVTYIITWWLVFFMALPWGVSPVERPEVGHDPGAPAKPRLLLKAGIATVAAALATAGVAWLMDSGLIQLRGTGAPF